MYKLQQARPNTECQAGFRQKYLPFQQFKSESKVVKDQPKTKKRKKIDNKLQDPLKLYELYLKALQGTEFTEEDQKDYERLIGKCSYDFHTAFYPDGVISFPNPDYEEVARPQQMRPLEFFDFVQQALKINPKSLNDQLLFKAIETSYQLLSISQSELQNSLSSDPFQLQSQQSDVRYKQFFTQQTLSGKRFSKSIRPILSAQEKLNYAMKSLREKFEAALSSNMKANLIDFINLDYKSLEEAQIRCDVKGEYLNQIQEQWFKTPKEALDTSTMLRNAILIQLSRKGFQTRQVISNDGRWIFLLIKMDEENLKVVAEQKKLSKRLNFWFSDLFSLEPVDKRLRPLRLNNRLWKPYEYKCTTFFEYLRPQIIELIEQINFKRLSREVNQSHINQELFQYGKQDLNDEEDNGPTDDEWFAFYKYLVHLKKCVSEHRQQNIIDSDLSAILNKQMDSFQLYIKRFQKELISQGLGNKQEIFLNKQNILNPENKQHLEKLEVYDHNAESLMNEYKQYMIEQNIPLTKYIKILQKERLAYNYMQAFIESLEVANDSKKYLKNLWDQVDLTPQEPYINFRRPTKKMAPTLQAQQQMIWCKYQKDEDGNISVFSSIDRLKLVYFAVDDCFDINSFTMKGYINQFFCLNDQYELLGYCQNFEKALTSETQFYHKKLFFFADEWKFRILEPWFAPIDVICSYYGEKIGLYFFFMSYYTKMLTFISVCGFGCSLAEWILNNQDGEASIIITMIFTFVLIQWNSIVTDYWKQQQVRFNLKYGQLNEKEKSTERSSFKGTFIRSLENDQLNSAAQDDSDLVLRLFLASILLVLLIAAYSGLVVGLFTLTTALRNSFGSEFSNVSVMSLEVTLSATINVFVQLFVDKFYDYISTSVTDFENHKTMQKYETSFVVKKFILYFCSYVVPLLFIGYLNGPLNLYCSKSNCSRHVQYYFSTIIIWQFLFKILQLFKFISDLAKYPKIKYEINDNDIQQFIDETSRRQSYAISPERYGTLEDYMEILILYSLLIIFGYSFPLSFFLLWSFNILQLQVKKYSFMYCLQRPWPQNESSLGIWNNILDLVNQIGILTNTGIITVLYNKKYGEQLVLVFLSLLISNSLFKFVIASVFGDTPFRLTQLTIRHKYLLKSTLEIFSKTKQSTKIKKEEEDIYKRFPLFKVYSSTNNMEFGSFQTISSQSDLEEHIRKGQLREELNQKRETKVQPKKIDLDDPPYELLHNQFSQRVSNWAFEIQYNNLNPFQRKKKLIKYWKYLYKLSVLTTYKKLWTEDRLTQRHFYMKRKKLAIKNLDQRKLNILKQNYKLTHQVYSDNAQLKFRKKFQQVTKNSNKPDDIKEYENMVQKQQNYIEKNLWLNCRKVVVLKIKAIWIRGFRKTVLRRSAIQNIRLLTKTSVQNGTFSLKSNIHKQYNKLLETNQKMDGYSMKEFINMVSQLNFEQIDQIVFPLTSQSLNIQQYILYPKKSYIFKTVIDQLRDTFIFDTQTTKLQEIAMQFFIEEQFQIQNIELIKHYHDNIWLGRKNDQEYLVQFLQVTYNQKLQFQQKLDSKHGVYYAESKNYLRLSNIIDQIDDFVIKGYCLCLYELEKPLSLWQVIKFRKTYGIDYKAEEINEFLYANLILMKSKPHPYISIFNYFLDGRQYALLNTLKSEQPLYNLAKVIIQMICLKQIDDPYQQLEQMDHKLTDVLRAMLDNNITIDQIVYEIRKQYKFKEIQYASDIFKSPDQSFNSQIQLYLHKINCSFRMKFYDQTLNLIQQFDNILKREYPPQNKDAVSIFSRSLKDDISKIILQPNYMQRNLDIILIYYLKMATLCALKLDFDEDLNSLLTGIQSCSNEINLIIRQLCLNIEFQNLNPTEQHTLLRKRKKNKQNTRLFSEQRMFLLETLRYNQEYLNVIIQYKSQLQRYSNQLNIVQSIKQYFNKNYGFASFLIDDSIQNTQKIIKPVQLPVILEQARQISLEMFNLDQFSPQMDDDDVIDLFNKPNNDFNILDEIHTNLNYCMQYLYFQYLQLIVWFDEQNVMFDQNCQQFVKLQLQNIPVFDNLKCQILQLMKFEVHQDQIKSYEDCELGKYLILKIRKWNESNFNEIYDIIDSSDFQYMWVQLMTQSLINKTLVNRQIICEFLEQDKDDIRFILLRIRLLMQLLHMDDYQSTNIIINQNIQNYQKLNRKYEDKSKILQLKSLIKQYKYQYYYLEESWFQHFSLSQLRLTYLLAICYAFSPKHIENFHNQSSFEITQLQGALNQIEENKQQESFHLMLKAAQIVQLHDYCNLLDDEAIGFVKYQQLYTFITLSLQQGVGLQFTFEAIKRIVNYDINPSIFILLLIQQFISFQLIDQVDIFIRLIQKMQQNKSMLLEEAHEGFDMDLKIFTFFTKSQDMKIIKPYDQLYIRYPTIQQYKDLLLDSQSLFYFSLYHENIEEQQIQIRTQLRQLLLDARYTKMIQLYESLLLYFNMQIGEEVDQLHSKVARYQITEKTLFHAIICHQLSRYYVCRYDYQLAFNSSKHALNYIKSSQFEQAVIIKIEKNIFHFQNNIQNEELMKLFNLQLFDCIYEESDQYYNNVIDETFINEQILIHVESVINLQHQFIYQQSYQTNRGRQQSQYQQTKQNEQQQIFEIDIQLTDLLYLLQTLPFRSQQLKVFYIIAQYLLYHLTTEGIQMVEMNLKKNCKQRLKEISSQISSIKLIVSQKIQQKELTQEEFQDAELRKQLLSFEQIILNSVEYGINKVIMLSWIHQSIDRALELCEYFQDQYMIKVHYFVPKFQLLQIRMYQEGEQLIKLINQISFVNDSLRDFYSNNSHPTKGVLYYLMGQQKRWLKYLYIKYIEQVIEFQQFNIDELRVITKGLLEQNLKLYHIWEKFDSPYRYTIPQQLEAFIIEEVGNIVKEDNNVTDLKVFQATGIVEELIQQFQNQIDVNGNLDFIYSASQFDYFKQDNFYTQDIKFIQQQDKLKQQQEQDLQQQQQQAGQKRR
ncbi:unnamed protein product [Paramecium octaurelia]|uniref:Anoctamin transmembrane domain-containing protein n=1 Tax=Paramecium octaurelia TaxID=43137 RepID=A0A8S1VFN5_PAROT|nr:unnamed protein product [Paramecium octaurelia]